VDPLLIQATYFQTFFLVFTRVGGVVVTMPVLGSRNIPPLAKIGLAGFLAFALTPTAPTSPLTIPNAFLPYVILIVQELALGLLFGFASQVVFSGIQAAGQLLGTQMGLTIAGTFDPVTQSQQTNYIDQLYAVVAGLLFLTINGHHLTIQALQQSFDLVPLGTFALAPAVSNDLVRLTSESIVLALRIGLPVAAALIVSDVAFLMIGRSAPQMNVFFVGQPLKIGIGLIAFFAAMPPMVSLMGQTFTRMPEDLLRILGAGG